MLTSLYNKFRCADIVVFSLCLCLCSVSLITLYLLGINGISSKLTSGFSRKGIIIQAAAVLLGAVIYLSLLTLGGNRIRRLSLPAFFILSVPVILTLTPLGITVDDDSAWLYLGGVSIQPSEFLKPALILALSFVLSSKKGRRVKFLSAVLISIYACTLIFLQKDIGTLLIFVLIALSMLFCAGLDKRLAALGVILSPLLAAGIWRFVLNTPQRERIASLLDPSLDPYGTGYQQLSARRAIESGGLFGKIQNGRSYVYVSSSHNDFILSFIAQLFGTLGIALICLIFVIILIRTAPLKESSDEFAFFARAGVFTLIASQALINIAMNLSLFPVVGITLPFVSSGGSALAASFACLGIAHAEYSQHQG